LIGKGGTGAVYEAVDAASGTKLALKRLLPDAVTRSGATLRFRREYASLAQLKHPLIIRAHDYAVDGDLPYYTMDLLAGDDLVALGPVAWREACSLLRDVSSALALVHSRRLVHRDVTARNVRRTLDGKAKLLDFGALCPMGVSHEVIGTPPFVSPESLAGQPLDARSDLFSLGALSYLLLTGRHAFPASSFSELYGLYSRRLDPPSAHVPEIPHALDELVLSLLSLNPLARAGSAAEVFERFTAIAALEVADAPEIAQAYLVTPTLVGRDDAVLRFRRRLLRAMRREGSSLLIEGNSGFGRSRLLTTFLTEAKLEGMVALYAEGERGRDGPFAVVRSLVRRLIESNGVPARASAAGADLVSRMGGESGEPSAAGREEWPALVDALSSWLVDVASDVALAIGVDDVERCDDVSLSVLMKLAEAAPSRRLLILLTGEARSTASAVRRFREFGSAHLLRPLRASHTRELVKSVFGDVPHVELVADWVHSLAEGSPRIALSLAQHLVDRGVARYEQGGWVLPASLRGLDLPSSLDQALDQTVAALSPVARSLAQSLALVSDEPLLVEEYTELVDRSDAPRIFEALRELVAASVLTARGSTYVFAHDALKRAVERGIAEERRPALHERLARAYVSGRTPVTVVAAYHEYLSGDPRRAFASFAVFVSNRRELEVRGWSFLRSKAGAEFFDELFDWAVAHGVSPAEQSLVGRTLIGLGASVDARLLRHASTVLRRLERDTGLVHWGEFEDVSDPRDRILRCMGRALAVHEATPPSERGLHPRQAVRELATTSMLLSAAAGVSHDAASVAALAPNVERLRPLSPAMDIVADVQACVAVARRTTAPMELRLLALERLAAPIEGLDDVYRNAFRLTLLYHQGLQDAVADPDVVFDRIKPLEQNTTYAPLAHQIAMIAYLFQGAEKRAQASRRKRDLARVDRSDVEQQVESGMVMESVAYVILGDMMALKRLMPEMEERAERWPAWRPYALIVSGTYHAIRGDLERGLELCQQALRLASDGQHAVWILAVNRVARLLLQTTRVPEAYELCRDALVRCETDPQLSPYVDLLEMALATAEARMGERVRAVRRADAVVARAENQPMAGILAMEIHAERAQIAQLLKDEPAFEAAAKKVGDMAVKVDSVAFATKLSSILRLPLGAGFEPVDAAIGTIRIRPREPELDPKLRTELELCRGADERAKRVLSTMLRHAGVSKGFLYLNQSLGPVLCASRSNESPPLETEEYLDKWVRSFWGGSEDETTSDGASALFGHRFALIGLTTSRGDEPVVAGVAVLDCKNERARTVGAPVLSVLAEVLLNAGDAIAV
jgi:serine/threonine-protein kinase